jgi:hypothetical protein
MLALLTGIPATAYAALFGALLSASIAFVGVYLTHRGNTNRLLLQLYHERDLRSEELLRDKLEELYLLLDKWLEALSLHFLPYFKVMQGRITYNDVLDLTIREGQNRDHDFARLEVLVDLYFPSLRPSYNDITAARDQANDVLAEHKREYLRGQTMATEYIKPLNDALAHLDGSGEQMKHRIVELFQKRFLTRSELPHQLRPTRPA